MSQGTAGWADGGKPQLVWDEGSMGPLGGREPAPAPSAQAGWADEPESDDEEGDDVIDLTAAADADMPLLTDTSGGGLESPSRRALKARLEARRLLRDARVAADRLLDEARAEAEDLQSESGSLRATIHALREELERLTDEEAVTATRLDEVRTTAQRIDHEAHRRAERLVSDATAEASALRIRTRTEQADAESALNRLRGEHEAYAAQAQALRVRTESEVDELRAEAEALKAEVDRARRQLTELAEDAARASEQEREARAAAEKLQQETQDQAERLIAEATVEAQSMRAEAASARASAQAYSERLRAAGDLCREQVVALRTEAETLGDELAGLREALDRVNRERMDAEERLYQARDAARRVDQEARDDARRLLIEARAQADLVSPENTERPGVRREGAPLAGEERPQDWSVLGQPPAPGLSDRLTGFHWDAPAPPYGREDDDMRTAAASRHAANPSLHATSASQSRDTRRGYADDPQPDGGPNVDLLRQLEQEAAETLENVRQELASHVERRMSEMTAVAERPAPEAPPAGDVAGFLAHLQGVVDRELQRLSGAGAAAGPSEEAAPPQRGAEELAPVERESPQPLIGSGGWYAAVPAALDPDHHDTDADADRRGRGRLFRRG